MSEPASLRTEPSQTHDAYLRYGTPGAYGPLVFAVPHAGRDYSPDLCARARVPPEALARLEDRFADHLVHGLIEQGHSVLVARQPRALIDLNRDEREVDPRGITGAPWSFRGLTSAKLRGGLGLVPERLTQIGNLWREPLPFDLLRQRIEQVHRPYHATLAAMLEATHRQHGAALLVDIHSMPPLRETLGAHEPASQIVIGDRFGRSAADQLTDLCADLIRRRHIPVAVNSPYSGNHILERHGRPALGVHAIQIEIDRSLYLEDDLMSLGAGLLDMRRMLSELAQVLTQELAGRGLPLAAE